MKSYDQIIVEMPSVAFFLYVNKQYFLENTTLKEQQCIRDWFLQVNNLKYGENNWQFFGILINTIFDEMYGMDHSEKIIEHWKIIDNCYLGNGWYSDGKTKQRDYYISFAYHFYSLLWIYIGGKTAKLHEAEIKRRAELFANDFIYFFAEDGSAIPFGRSLTYRFAQVAFWSAYELVGLKGISIGTVKGIINRNLRWWLDKDIFNSDGLLNVGYTYPNLVMAEHYNATGSPYWAFKVFVILLLPLDNPFWTIEECALQLPEGNKVLYTPQFCIARHGSNVALFPANLQAAYDWETATAKYEKIAYSTQFGFNVSRGKESFGGSALDSTFALSYDGTHLIEKHRTDDTFEDNGTIVSKWVPDQFTKLKCIIVPGAPWHIRIFQIETKRATRFYDFGFAISSNNGVDCINKDNYIELNSNDFSSAIMCVYGNGVTRKFTTLPNTNIIHPKTEIPYCTWLLSKGKYLLTDFVYGGEQNSGSIIPEAVLNGHTLEVHMNEFAEELKFDVSFRKAPFNILRGKLALRNIKNLLRSQ